MSDNEDVYAAYSDAAAIMRALAVPDTEDSAAADQAVRDLVTHGTRAELRTALFAALQVGSWLINAEVRTQAELDGTPGPALELAVSLARDAADLKTRND